VNQCALQTNRFLQLFVVFMFTSIIYREYHSLFSSEEMYALFDKRAYPASVAQSGHPRAQQIDRPSTPQTSQKELSLVRSALQRSDQPGTFKYARTLIISPVPQLIPSTA